MTRKVGSKDAQLDRQSEGSGGAKPPPGVRAPEHSFGRIHQMIGNRRVGRLVQAKLRVSNPGDAYEREADQVAEQVMRMPDPVADNGAVSRQRVVPQIHRTCTDCEEEMQTKVVAGQTATADHGLESRIESIGNSGEPISTSLRGFFEPRFGHDFSQVRLHTGAAAGEIARDAHAAAFTVGRDIVFSNESYTPETESGRKLLAHELTHVVQQSSGAESTRVPDVQRPEPGASPEQAPSSSGPPLSHGKATPDLPGAVAVEHRSPPRIAKQNPIAVTVISSRDEYRLGNERHRVGDAAAGRILMDIVDDGGQITYRVFNFLTGAAETQTPHEWSFYLGSAIIGMSGNAGITRLGQQLSPSDWRTLWPNPMPELLRRYEAGQLALDDQAVLTGYKGMIRSSADRSLDENERTVDELLGAGDRVARIREYATGLREASIVRDTLVQRRDELNRRLVAQHSFRFGPPITGTGPNMVQQLDIIRDRSQVEDTLAFWLSAFPLLTRLQTQEISPGSVEQRLSDIKSNIIATRADLNRGRLDPMTLDAVRARLTGGLGPRATGVVAAEDRSRSRWAMVGAVATMAASIAILFLPGGIFIDMAIGIAIAGEAVADALQLGRAANTGLHVDDGLVSQSQADSARFAAVLAVVFALLGAAAASFRVLRVGLALRGLSRTMPELALAERAAVARVLADDAALLSTFTQLGPGDAAISARVAAAVRQAAGNPRALRTALTEVAEIARIPRRVPTSADLYEPLRRITDGSDIARIAQETGMARAEVEAAKRNLMLDEHILVDNAGALYRSRFEPFEEAASVWGRAARGEPLANADREFLKRLVKHEQVEGAILSSQARTLEQAFLRRELEGNLRTFLQSRNIPQGVIDNILRTEPRPMTPYRYAHLVAHYSGGPNP